MTALGHWPDNTVGRTDTPNRTETKRAEAETEAGAGAGARETKQKGQTGQDRQALEPVAGDIQAPCTRSSRAARENAEIAAGGVFFVPWDSGTQVGVAIANTDTTNSLTPKLALMPLAFPSIVALYVFKRGVCPVDRKVYEVFTVFTPLKGKLIPTQNAGVIRPGFILKKLMLSPNFYNFTSVFNKLMSKCACNLFS